MFTLRTVGCVAFLLFSPGAFSQCDNDMQQVTSGYNTNADRYIASCPRYVFAYGGDTSRSWKHILNPIDISQAPPTMFSLKKKVEDSIRKYSGKEFYQRLQFEEVHVSYPDSMKSFQKDKIMVDAGNCQAAYVFFYLFRADSFVSYQFSVSLDKKGRIFSKFDFPSIYQYKKIDTTLTYCKMIGIARSLKKDIEPIDEITFDYNDKTKRFFWVVTEKIKNEKSGANTYHTVKIDAADPRRHTLYKWETFIEE